MAKPRAWPVIAAAAVGIAILFSLGAWQVQRLAWKQALIAELNDRATVEPVDVATVEQRLRRGEGVEYSRVTLEGTFEHRRESTVVSVYGGGPAFTIVTPLIMTGGSAVLVDRGQVPEPRRNDVVRPEGTVRLTGVVRLHDAGPGYFDVANDAAARAWYWWDVPAMQRASDLPQTTKWLPFVVQLLPGAVAEGFPQPPEPRANLTNNHLGYAITWFGLAAALAAVAGVYLRGQNKKSTA